MQVILKEDVRHVGDIGDVVNVKPGFARNFLFPRGLAIPAQAGQLRRVEHEKRLIEVRLEKTRAAARDLAEKFNGFALIVKKQAGEGDRLFGSVTTMEMETLLNEKGFSVERRQISVEEPIKTLGKHQAKLRLHRDVIVTLNIEVMRDEV
jgi:large subunit ribosomal protein L9